MRLLYNNSKNIEGEVCMKKEDFVVKALIIAFIIGLFGPIVQEVFYACSRSYGHRRENSAKTQLKYLGVALKLYKMKKGVYPKTLELLTIPNRSGDTFLDAIPLDPWGNEYIYKKIYAKSEKTFSSGKKSKFEIICLGADGAPGGKGENFDIKYSELHKKQGE